MKALIRKYFGNTGFHYFLLSSHTSGFPGGSEVKASARNARNLGSIPGSGISPGEGNGNPLQYSCLKNPMDRGAWRATVHGVAKSWTRLSDFTFTLEVFMVIIKPMMTMMTMMTIMMTKSSLNQYYFLHCLLLSSYSCQITENFIKPKNGIIFNFQSTSAKKNKSVYKQSTQIYLLLA